MPSERVALRHEQETMLMTLYLHARDATGRADRSSVTRSPPTVAAPGGPRIRPG